MDAGAPKSGRAHRTPTRTPKRLSDTRIDLGHHTAGRRPVSRSGVVPVVLQTVAPGNVSGRFENHPGHGTANLSHPSHGPKRTAGLLHRSQLAPRDHGPSGG